jgi:hypothetical protein
MKKVWSSPKLEVLDIRMTMNGPNGQYPDCLNAQGANHGSETSPNPTCAGS